MIDLKLLDRNWKLCHTYMDGIIVCGTDFYEFVDHCTGDMDKDSGGQYETTAIEVLHMEVNVPFLGHIAPWKSVWVDPYQTMLYRHGQSHDIVKYRVSFKGLPHTSYYRHCILGFVLKTATITNFPSKGVDLVYM